MGKAPGPNQETSNLSVPLEVSVPDPSDTIVALIASITAQFDLAMARPELLSADCTRLREQLGDLGNPTVDEHVIKLVPLLTKRVGAIAHALFALLEEAAASSRKPWPILHGMLGARDQNLSRRAVDLALRLAESGLLAVDQKVVLALAECAESEGSALADPVQLSKFRRILSRFSPKGPMSPDPILDFYLHDENLKLRRLAARILDLRGQPVPSEISERFLGPKDNSFLRPYLEYTRAGYLDMLCLVHDPSSLSGAIGSLKQAELDCGPEMLKDAIGKLGWARLNLGLEVRHYIGVSVGGSFPLLVSPAEAALMEGCGDSRRISESYLFIAHGGLPAEGAQSNLESAPVDRFRAYNLAHAEVLRAILDLSPLTKEKVRWILCRMDRIVEDFVALFEAYTPECAILPGIYRNLRQAILLELKKDATQMQLSMELTRLVQMFEDPRTLGGVRTLHGLKRYLHQKGLRLGMKLVEAVRGTNRTVDLLVLSRSCAPLPIRRIRYVDFEPRQYGKKREVSIPFPVALVAEGFARQLLAGQEKFPEVRAFCYGNEVHYYLAFGNHPAFLRIDYSPPLQGGMIDLEYYGVSKYEMSLHPNLGLDAIRLFFRSFEFDIQIEQTRIHARYDKERALDFASICEKARLLFRFVPFLMDIDWIIGNLNLNAEAREKVAAAWLAFLENWGTLPIWQFLSMDRRSILVGIESGPTADRELVWSGEGCYRDRFVTPFPGEHLRRLHACVTQLGVSIDAPAAEGEHTPFGQMILEREVLEPLRSALEHGELVSAASGFLRCVPDLFEPAHEAEIFAGMLAASNSRLASSARLALLVGSLEKTIRFSATGLVNGYETQHACMSIQGETLGLYTLRDSNGIIRLAIFAEGDALYRRRDNPSDPWRPSWSCDTSELSLLLRGNNYLTSEAEPEPVPVAEEISRIHFDLGRPNPLRRAKALQGEQVVAGLRASPGRKVGRALFGTAGRLPEDLDGAVLVAESVRPEDNTFIYHSSGVVSTGGGILSHAGLIALQFRKPALIVSGEWVNQGAGSVALSFQSLEYHEEEREVRGIPISIFLGRRNRENRLQEGDLVVLDANEGILRSLGQGREVLAFHAGLQLFGEASDRIRRLADDKEILRQRGHRLRARHLLEKLLLRIGDAVLVRHAVEEILTGDTLPDSVSPSDKARFLSILLNNSRAGDVARETLWQSVFVVEGRFRSLYERTQRQIPTSLSIYEVLALRIEFLRLFRSMEGIAVLLKTCGLAPANLDASAKSSVDTSATCRLKQLREHCISEVSSRAVAPRFDFRVRHLVRLQEKLDLALGLSGEEHEKLHHLARRQALEDKRILRKHQKRRVISSEESGFELHSLIGWKAANLAEIGRLGGDELVPAWFVVTHKAFEEILDQRLEQIPPDLERVFSRAACLRIAIEAVLARCDFNGGQKSALIRNLWECVTPSPELAGDVIAAYRRLSSASANESTPGYVAIRSSSREEDAEAAARAGEFETFLFVRGDRALLEYLKRAWSGLWTERAIHNRSVLGGGDKNIGGGIIIQRVVSSRVSGVLQTANVLDCDHRQILINAGLGLGEGIVSGTVAADQIVVAKEDDPDLRTLRFRYVTADKREQVVFNKRTGTGTARVETLYHQRLRPALEYVELCELVRISTRLEAAYGYPLDIEFAFEGTQLRILQARPIAGFLSAVCETVELYPLCRTS